MIFQTRKERIIGMTGLLPLIENRYQRLLNYLKKKEIPFKAFGCGSMYIDTEGFFYVKTYLSPKEEKTFRKYYSRLSYHSWEEYLKYKQ